MTHSPLYLTVISLATMAQAAGGLLICCVGVWFLHAHTDRRSPLGWRLLMVALLVLGLLVGLDALLSCSPTLGLPGALLALMVGLFMLRFEHMLAAIMVACSSRARRRSDHYGRPA